MAYHYPFHTPEEKKTIYVMIEALKSKDKQRPEVMRELRRKQLSLDGFLNGIQR